VATRSLAGVETTTPSTEDEDFVLFTKGINQSSKGDKLGISVSANSAFRSLFGKVSDVRFVQW